MGSDTINAPELPQQRTARDWPPPDIKRQLTPKFYVRLAKIAKVRTPDERAALAAGVNFALRAYWFFEPLAYRQMEPSRQLLWKLERSLEGISKKLRTVTAALKSDDRANFAVTRELLQPGPSARIEAITGLPLLNGTENGKSVGEATELLGTVRELLLQLSKAADRARYNRLGGKPGPKPQRAAVGALVYLMHTWSNVTGRKPGITVDPDGGAISGRFVEFAQASMQVVCPKYAKTTTLDRPLKQARKSFAKFREWRARQKS
jgi:hypothetical protein